MFYISKLCTFMANPSRACFGAAPGLLLYMGATENMGLRFDVQNKKLSTYFEPFDASIAANFGVHGFSDSSCETEYASAASIAKEMNYLRNLAFDLEIRVAVVVGVDHDAAIKTASMRVSRNATTNMHWERLINYARQSVNLNRVEYIWVDTTQQMADFLTKGDSA